MTDVTIGGLPPANRNIAPTDKFEIEDASGNPYYLTGQEIATALPDSITTFLNTNNQIQAGYLLTVQTTNATPLLALSLSVSANSGFTGKFRVSGKKNDFTACASSEFIVDVIRETGGNVTLANSITYYDYPNGSVITYDVNITAQTFEIWVTGGSSQTWNWTITYNIQ